MFTGLIEEIGVLEVVEAIPDGKRIKIAASKIMDDLRIDHSVSVNGVCLTVIKIDTDSFWAEAVGETLKKTTFYKLNQNLKVNLERAVRLSDRLGGHLVQGHVNGIGVVKRIIRLGDNYSFEIEIPNDLAKYVIREGSIAIDGISLTVANLTGNLVGLSIIPHTWNNTNMHLKRISDEVNIEVDIIAKYLEKLFNKEEKPFNSISGNTLKDMGY